MRPRVRMMPTNVFEKIWLVFLPLVSVRVFGAQEDEGASVFADLPLAELLIRKKLLTAENLKRGEASFLSAVPSPEKQVRLQGSREVSVRKTFDDEYRDDDEGYVLKKKEKHKINDLLNVSVTALSYLAFGGYLLCMIVGAIREKRRRFLPASPQNPQLAAVLQQYLAQRPVRVKFPAVTLNHGGKKRRKRSGGGKPTVGERTDTGPRDPALGTADGTKSPSSGLPRRNHLF